MDLRFPVNVCRISSVLFMQLLMLAFNYNTNINIKSLHSFVNKFASFAIYCFIFTRKTSFAACFFSVHLSKISELLPKLMTEGFSPGYRKFLKNSMKHPLVFTQTHNTSVFCQPHLYLLNPVLLCARKQTWRYKHTQDCLHRFSMSKRGC